MELNWLGRAVIATMCFVPIMISAGMFSRHFGLRSEAIITWYSAGQIVTAPFLLTHFGVLNWQEMSLSKPMCVVLVMGMTLGVASNIFFFQALSTAPNPGLAMAVTNSATIIVFLITVLLAQLLPQYFSASKLDPWHLVGIVLTVTGISIIALRQ